MIIRAQNFLDSKAPYTFFASAGTAGASSIAVANINNFTANWAIQIGKTGEEKSEIILLTSATPSGTTLSVTGTLKYDHPIDTPIYAIKWDKIIFKRSTSGTAGTATAITGGTVNITPDGTVTPFDDTSAASTYAYKLAFYNSATGDFSSDSDWLTPEGYTFYSLAYLKKRVKNKLFNSQYLQNDDIVVEWVNEWMEQLNNAAVDVNKDYSLGTTNVAFTSEGLGTISSASFKDVRRFEITYNGTEYFLAYKKDLTDFYPNETFNSSHPYYIWRGDNVFDIKPPGTGGTARLSIYQLSTPLVNETDELPVVMRGYTNSFVNYALSEAYYLDDKINLGDRYSAKAMEEKRIFISQITPRSKTGPVFVKLMEPVTGDDSEYLTVWP